MNDIRMFLNLGVKITLSLFLLTLTSTLLASDASEVSEVITTIILINREAELVDLDMEGEILRRYVAIPDYFSSGRSHNSSLRKSLKLIKSYGEVKKKELPGSSLLDAECLQSFMNEKLKYLFCDVFNISTSQDLNLSFQPIEELPERTPTSKTLESLGSIKQKEKLTHQMKFISMYHHPWKTRDLFKDNLWQRNITRGRLRIGVHSVT